MNSVVDYYFAPQSPWTYLGHPRFAEMVARHGATVRIRPVDLGQVFPVSGGLPLGKRAPQRQTYRLAEMARFSQHLGMPMNLQPRFFPVAGDPASRLIIAVDLGDGTSAAMKLAGAVFAAVWAQERDIADAAVLGQLLAECGFPEERLAHSQTDDVNEVYQRYTREAIDAGVFGAPSYVIGGDMYWGQDRLDFVERALRDNAGSR
ncbi:2-hydroxychromene-2-carboxylate isomerase [Variovorax dokdonensis]|uniref:2-hydroxychromene-2-carboxylate isomerase n=1 Tax=Variovorax dokdonensis TaxID=344883 RepID=A0ABT7NFX3_9BURK|nr:2-hydroxychromene-2-carboxylate isomerase [Variovorax dokdonensis]MDM0046844.1 2-hydroxychromene-2-carboxylate isomerase [Variovorax dokdonensis]